MFLSTTLCLQDDYLHQFAANPQHVAIWDKADQFDLEHISRLDISSQNLNEGKLKKLIKAVGKDTLLLLR